MDVECYCDRVLERSAAGFSILLEGGRVLFVRWRDWRERNEPQCVGDYGWVWIPRHLMEAADG